MNCLSSLACVLLGSAALAAQRQPAGEGDRAVNLYDVRDLLARPRLDLVDSKPDPFGLGGDAGMQTALVPRQTLAELVRAFLPPPAVAPGDVSVVGGTHLVAAGTSEQQAWIERLLVRVRANQDMQLTVQARTLAVRRDVFERDVLPVLQRARAPREGEGEPSTAVLAQTAETLAFLEGLESREGVAAVAAPRLACWVGQRASVFVGEQVSYIRDFELHHAAGGQVIADPVVDVARHGTQLDLATTLLEDGSLGLLLTVAMNDVARPLAEAATRLPGAARPVTIQLPRQRTARVRAALALPRRHLALIALPAIGDERYVTVLRVEQFVAPDRTPTEPEDRLAWTFDVRDLVVAGRGGHSAKEATDLGPRERPAHETLPLRGRVADSPRDHAADGATRAPAELLGLANVVRAFVAPALRTGDQVTASGPWHLVFKGLPEQQQWIDRYLARQRQQPPARWTLKPQVLVVPRPAYESELVPLLREHRLRAVGTNSRQVVLPDDAETGRLLAEATRLAGADVTALPALAVERFAPAESRDGLRHTKYVRDFAVKDVGGTTTCEPVEDIVRDGSLLEWTVAALPDGTAGVVLQATAMDLQRPIPTFETKVGDRAVRIDLPRVTLQRGTAALALAPGHVGLVSLPLGERKQVLVVVRIEGGETEKSRGR